jgi:2-iminobutanoate/2-iminopropanoate deaminase
MSKQIIESKQAPAPIGPYSQAIIHNGLLYISGQIGINPATGELNMADLQTETHQVMANLQNILQTAGSSFDKVIKTTIFLMDMKQFAVVNEVYGSYFTAGNYPARETVQVSALPKFVNVEISMLAIVD